MFPIIVGLWRPSSSIRMAAVLGCGGSVSKRKNPDIYRSDRGGNCLGSIGRWGLGSGTDKVFSFSRALQSLYLRDFTVLRPWNFDKNAPNCHSSRWQFGAQSGKTVPIAIRWWAIASRFGWKTKKSAYGALLSGKIFIFASQKFYK